MGCKCVIPNFEQKDEISSDRSKVNKQKETNTNIFPSPGGTTQTESGNLKSSKNKNLQYEKDHEGINNNNNEIVQSNNYQLPISFENEKENDNYNIFKSAYKDNNLNLNENQNNENQNNENPIIEYPKIDNLRNENPRNENEINENEINENPRNENEINDNPRNENEMNDNPRNENEISDNLRNENEINDNPRNENEINENEINDNPRNENEISDNLRNENEINDNPRNENEINDNPRNENEINENEINQNQINQNPLNENPKNENPRNEDSNQYLFNMNYETPISSSQLNKNENQNDRNKYFNNEDYVEPVVEDPFNKNNSNEKDDSINELPEDNFSKYIFEQINKIRRNPKEFIPKIEESKKNITTDKNGRLIYRSKVKVALNKGLPVFEDAILFLEKTEPMDELKFSLKISVPAPQNEDDIKNKNYLKEKIEEINQNDKIVQAYWRDIINDEETNFILMIVDDNGPKSNKRKNIFNPKFKYIGIRSVKIGKSFACYITLSESNKL